MGTVCSRNNSVRISEKPISTGSSRHTSKASDYSSHRERREKVGRNHDSMCLPNGKKGKCIIEMTSAIISPHDLRRVQASITERYVIILSICITIPGSRKSTVVFENANIHWGKLRVARQVPEKVSLISGQGTTHVFAILNTCSTHDADITLSGYCQGSKVVLVSTVSRHYLATLDDIHEFVYTLQKENRRNKASTRPISISSDTGYFSTNLSEGPSVITRESNHRFCPTLDETTSIEKSYITEYGVHHTGFPMKRMPSKKDLGTHKTQGSSNNVEMMTTKNINIKQLSGMWGLESEPEMQISHEDHRDRLQDSLASFISFTSSDSDLSSRRNYFSASDADLNDRIYTSTTGSDQLETMSANSNCKSDSSRRKQSKTLKEKDMDRRPINPTPDSGSSVSSCHSVRTQAPQVGKQRRPTPFNVTQAPDSHRKKCRRLSPSQKAIYMKKVSPGNSSLRDIPLMEVSEDEEKNCHGKYKIKGNGEEGFHHKENIKKKTIKQRTKSEGETREEIVKEEIIVEKVIGPGCCCEESVISTMNLVPDITCRKSMSGGYSELRTLKMRTFRKTKSMPVIHVRCVSRDR